MVKSAILIFALVSITCFGQGTFQRAIGGYSNEIGRSVNQTKDGYIVGGRTSSFGAGNYDVYVVRTDLNGIPQWKKAYGGVDDEISYTNQQTNDGGFIIGGETASYGSGDYDIFLIKTDSLGTIIWSKTYGGTGSDEGASVLQTTDHGYIIAGFTNSYGAGNGDIYIVKTDSSGNLQWTRTFGGASADGGIRIKHTSDGGYIVAGTSYSYGDGSGDFIILKLNSFGLLLWARNIGETSSLDQATDILEYPLNNYVICGQTRHNNSASFQSAIVRIDQFGSLLWSKKVSVPNGGKLSASSLQPITNGYLVFGLTVIPSAPLTLYACVIRFDTIGALISANAPTNRESSFFSAQKVSNEGVDYYVATGYVRDSTLHADILLAKLDANGLSGCDMVFTVADTAWGTITTPILNVSSGGIETSVQMVTFSGGDTSTLCSNVLRISEKYLSSEIKIYPSPAKGELYISFASPETTNCTAILFDYSGEFMSEREIRSNLVQLDLSQLVSGLYFMKILDSRGNLICIKKIPVVKN